MCFTGLYLACALNVFLSFLDATKLKGDNGEPLGKMLQDCAHVGLCTDFYNRTKTWTVPDEEVILLLLQY